ncbi:MAG: DUF1311 domain-containing protein [Desulfovibrio sp.]|nr:DUF1311 domain-containing protein [Desulfovibrio sp.]
MNKSFRYFFSISVLLCACCLPGPSRAMSYADYLRLLHASPAYQAADRELNAVWANAKKSLARETFCALRQEQRLWLKERDSLAAAFMAQKLPLDQAYARITRDRTAVIAEFLQKDAAMREEARAVCLTVVQTAQAIKPAVQAKPFFAQASRALLHRALVWQMGKPVAEGQVSLRRYGVSEQSNQASAKPSLDLCDAFRISTRFYYGHYVPRPFVSLNLSVKKGRRVSSLMVNNYEIRRIKRYSKDLPQWKRRSDRILELNLFTDTILNDIAIVYNDGTMCRIDNISVDKDMTNPYN